MEPQSHASGFTLLELVITIALISVVAVFAIPSAGQLLHNSRRHSAVGEMVTLLNLARNTAIMEQQTITLCPLGDDNRCADLWNSRPVTVFRDPDRDRTLAAPEDIVRVGVLAEGGTWDAHTANRPYLRFFASGMSSYAIGNLVWCPNSGEDQFAAQVVVNMGGRPRLAEDQNGDGLIEDADGNSITCP